MTVLTTIILSLILPAVPHTQDSQATAQYEKKAVQILNDAKMKLSAHEALRIAFSYSALDPFLDAEEETEGYMFTMGDMFYINFEDIHFISDGKMVWTLLESFNEVHISRLEDTEAVITPASLLEDFENTFMPLWIQTDSKYDKKLQVIDMVYREPQTFHKYRIGVDEVSGFLHYIIAYDLQGNTYTYNIKSFEIDPEIPDGIFTFDPAQHPDIEIIDLR